VVWGRSSDEEGEEGMMDMDADSDEEGEEAEGDDSDADLGFGSDSEQGLSEEEVSLFMTMLRALRVCR
jgi:hypothetical protein